jgi:hypothetical protein
MTLTFDPVHWPKDAAKRFGHDTLVASHSLHKAAQFSDASLAALLDVYPREKLGVFTMGHDPVDWQSWQPGSAGTRSGAELLEAVYAGRIWLNLRAVNHVLPAYHDLCEALFADKKAALAGCLTFKRDVGVLISSPGAQVFYHLDAPLVSLWQVRGVKQLYLYPPKAPFAQPQQIEAVILRETREQIPFDPAWDRQAQTLTLEPGMMVTWQQNAPHRIVNGPMVNVSLSVEFLTPAAWVRANVIYANGLLRRWFGLNPHIQAPWDPRTWAKVIFARAIKAIKRT